MFVAVVHSPILAGGITIRTFLVLNPQYVPVSEPVDTDVTNIKDPNERSYSIGPMHNKTRQLLNAFYRPHVERLSGLLNDDNFLWIT